MSNEEQTLILSLSFTQKDEQVRADLTVHHAPSCSHPVLEKMITEMCKTAESILAAAYRGSPHDRKTDI